MCLMEENGQKKQFAMETVVSELREYVNLVQVVSRRGENER
jgi:hypothetical protein